MRVIEPEHFVGRHAYLLAGPLGAGVATVGIFVPAFFFVAVSGPLVPRLRQSPMASAFLDGVNVASLALMAVVAWRLGESTVVDWLSAAIAGVAGVALIRWRINSSWLVLAGGILGV
ncbi:MAG: chromate transporter [Opitutaceae bacterium]